MHAPQSFRKLLCVSLLLLLVIGDAASMSAGPSGPAYQQPAEEATAYPPGAVVAFPRPTDGGLLPADKIHIRRQGAPAGAPMWLADARKVFLGARVAPERAGSSSEAHDTANAKPPAVEPEATGVGFVVPQLRKGVYEAWYGPAEKPGQTLTFGVAPQLTLPPGQDGAVAAPANSEVEVRVGIHASAVRVAGSATPQPVSVEVTLTSEDARVVELAPGQSATARTNAEGFAVWKVRVKSWGEASLVASAADFEPAVVLVRGEASAEQLAQAAREVERALELARETEQDAQRAEQRAESVERKEQKEVQTAEQRAERAEREVATGSDDEREDRKRRERAAVLKRQAGERDDLAAQRVANAKAEARSLSVTAYTRREHAQQLSERFRLMRPRPVMPLTSLKPGDVLLVRGRALVSYAILLAETRELGLGNASYSHAALYVGEVGSTRSVVEMLGNGLVLTPLAESIRQASRVDVKRWKGVSDRLAGALADRGREYHRRLGEAPIPYAYEQISVLGQAAAVPLTAEMVLRRLAEAADRRAGGRRKMICSELVAWVYSDLGLRPQVAYWRSLQNAGIISTDDRRFDYITPNVLALSGSFEPVGSLK